MYNKVKGGSEFKFGFDEEEFVMNLPPVGHVFNHFTGKIEKRPILYKSLPPKDRKVPKGRMDIDMPDEWDEWEKEEMKVSETNKGWVHEHAENFRRDAWDKRINGCWMSIYNPQTGRTDEVYLTGMHWMYIFFWRCDFGLPDFRFIDLEVFYLLKFTEEDPSCNGLTLATLRRFGKTAILGLFIFEYPSRVPNSYGGLQSKTGEDAAKVFALSLVYPWKNLPRFFRPMYDTASTQKSSIDFKVPSRGEGSNISVKNALNSNITFRDSGIYAYDGYKLHRYGVEEPGKANLDVYERHFVTKPCTEVQGRIVGQIFAPTTVEDMEGIAEEAFKKMFHNSFYSKAKKGKSGKTITGLYAHFIPAFKGYMFDDYGHSMIDESKRILLNEREDLANSPEELSSHMRKHPFTIEEAFMIGQDTCIFNKHILNQRLAEISRLPENMKPYTRGDLEWKEKDKTVEFFSNPQSGKFYFHYIPDKKHLNRIQASYDGIEPLNDARHAIGTDPISHTKTVDPKNSKAGAHGFRKYDPSVDIGKEMEDWLSHNYLFEYIHRPPEIEEYFEDMIKACVFLGCKILYESTKNNIGQYFRDRGYQNFLMFRPESTWTHSYSANRNMNVEGVPASKETIDYYVMKLKTFINRHGMRIPFPRTIKQLLKFDPTKTTVYDAAVSAGWTLVALDGEVEDNMTEIESTEWFSYFDNSGDVSQEVEFGSIN